MSIYYWHWTIQSGLKVGEVKLLSSNWLVISSYGYLVDTMWKRSEKSTMFLSSWKWLLDTISTVKKQEIPPPPPPVGYFRQALILFIEGHIAFKGNRAQASALIGSEMFWEEWLIGVVCLKLQFKYVLPPQYTFIFSPLRGSARGPKSQRCERRNFISFQNSNSYVLFFSVRV